MKTTEVLMGNFTLPMLVLNSKDLIHQYQFD
jgi:hypothetical protein